MGPAGHLLMGQIFCILLDLVTKVIESINSTPSTSGGVEEPGDCFLCGKGIYKPIALDPCGHGFCQDCFVRYCEEKYDTNCPPCCPRPDCQLIATDIVRNYLAEVVLSRSPVHVERKNLPGRNVSSRCTFKQARCRVLGSVLFRQLKQDLPKDFPKCWLVKQPLQDSKLFVNRAAKGLRDCYLNLCWYFVICKEVESLHSPVGGDVRCPVCLYTFGTPVITPCGHTFCQECIDKWIATKHNCPVCRQEVAKVIPDKLTAELLDIPCPSEEDNDTIISDDDTTVSDGERTESDDDAEEIFEFLEQLRTIIKAYQNGRISEKYIPYLFYIHDILAKVI